MEEKHHGISLKVTDTSNKHVPVSNPGIEHLHGKEIAKAHREHLIKRFPHLKNRNSTERAATMKSDSYMQKYVKDKNDKTLEKVTKNYSG